MEKENKKEIKEHYECECCGTYYDKEDLKLDETDVWTSTNGIIICNNCMFSYIDILRNIYKCQDIKEIKTIIEDYEEGSEDGFLRDLKK